MRHSCLQLARKHQAAYIQLYMRCPLQVALQRNALRPLPHRVPDSVLHRMASLLEQPNADKHAWEANTIVLESASWDSDHRYDVMSIGLCMRFFAWLLAYLHCQMLISVHGTPTLLRLLEEQ